MTPRKQAEVVVVEHFKPMYEVDHFDDVSDKMLANTLKHVTMGDLLDCPNVEPMEVYCFMVENK